MHESIGSGMIHSHWGRLRGGEGTGNHDPEDWNGIEPHKVPEIQM